MAAGETVKLEMELNFTDVALKDWAVVAYGESESDDTLTLEHEAGYETDSFPVFDLRQAGSDGDDQTSDDDDQTDDHAEPIEPWKFIHDYVLSNAREEEDSCQASSHTFWRADGSFAVSANMSPGCEHAKTFKFKLNEDAIRTIRSIYRTQMHGDQFQGCEPDE